MKGAYRISIFHGQMGYLSGGEMSREQAERLAASLDRSIVADWEQRAKKRQRRAPPPEIAVWHKVRSYKPRKRRVPKG